MGAPCSCGAVCVWVGVKKSPVGGRGEVGGGRFEEEGRE